MNYYALALAGFVHRIYRVCRSLEQFHYSLEKAKQILEKNQYPSQFYNPIIEKALAKLLHGDEESERVDAEPGGAKQAVPRKMIFLQYRGKVTENFCRELPKCNAPVMPLLTLRKLKTTLPSLKCCIDHCVRSHVVYKVASGMCIALCWLDQPAYIRPVLRAHEAFATDR